MDVISEVFRPEPAKWGLRGDPYLWRAMAARLSSVPLPATVDELERRIVDLFLAETGHSIGTKGHIRVEKFAHGGMSSGSVSPDFWRHTALPLLRERFQAHLRANP